MGHVAEGTTPGADVTHYHEGGGAVMEALSQIGAGGLFADRAESPLPQDAADTADLLADGRLGADPARLAQGL